METDLDRAQMRIEYLKDQLTAANKAIVAMADVLEKCAAYNSKLYYILKEECDDVLIKNAPAIEKARGG